jgi:hypothetical protein
MIRAKHVEFPHKLMEQWDWGYGFCCSTEGCRLWHTPVSVRFLGRKVYAGVFIVLISALMNGPNERRAGELHRELGLDVRTLKRWPQWWQKEFVSTPFWRWERSGFMPPVDESQLPDSHLQRFGSDARGPRRLVHMMKFLAAMISRWGLDGLPANSVLGKAITYLQRHWEPLTLFLRQPGAPIDNNACERALKKAILHRKNSMFYKTRIGARLGDLFMSIFYTCQLNKINPLHYMNTVCEHHAEVVDNPERWLPWNYQQAVSAIS